MSTSGPRAGWPLFQMYRRQRPNPFSPQIWRLPWQTFSVEIVGPLAKRKSVPFFALFILPLHGVTNAKAISSVLLAAWAGLVSVAGTADAHPHVFANGHVVLDVNSKHQMVAVTDIWKFDAPFSAMAVTGLDTNRDGKLEAQELEPLAETSMESLADYHFFTWVTHGGREAKMGKPRAYSYRLSGDRLVLTFTLPLEAPLPLDDDLEVEVFDPEYFVAYSFPDRDAAAIKGGAANCHATYVPPKPLDARIMAKLAAVPIEQHDLPPALADAAVGLAHMFTVACR